MSDGSGRTVDVPEKLGEYKCWLPEFADEEGAVLIKAESMRGAVEAYANTSYGEEEFDEIEIRVKPLSGKHKDKIFEFNVEAEVEVQISVGLGTEVTD